jgi:hypothetical protein
MNIQKIKEWFIKYDRHISSASLLTGFVIDNLTLRRIDLLFENLILLFYLTISCLSIILFNLHKGGVLRHSIFDKFIFVLPVVIQFTFGGLFSGFLVFYSRSASLLTSWPFLILILLVLITGETQRKFYERLSYQLTIFFVALFSFLIFYVPVLIHHMNEWTFLLSGVLALGLFYLLVRYLTKLVPALILASRKMIIAGVFIAFTTVNILYFTNILPPIPLSLKESGVYKLVERTSTGYRALAETDSGSKWWGRDETVHVAPGEHVYVYSSVFAPTDLNTQIVHHWQYLSKTNNEWATVSRVGFPIRGGRDGGYRGYTFKANATEGKWRVNVENIRGQIIGRLNFNVINIATPLPVTKFEWVEVY